MAPPSAIHTINVGTAGKLQIFVQQIAQNWTDNTSLVEVSGILQNNAPGTVVHAVADITCSIDGESDFTGAKFKFNLASGDTITFIDHQFVVNNESDGTKTVSFTVHYGTTGTVTFGDTNSVSVTLVLDRIPQQPGPPGDPAFSNIASQTLTVTWNGSSDNGGGTLNGYHLRRYLGSSASGGFNDNFAGNLTRNLTGLTPGAVYTFTVLADNDSKQNGGLSDPSDPVTVQMLGGCWIRVGGVWKIAVPYVRHNGIWQLAIPYVRFGGSWQPTS